MIVGLAGFARSGKDTVGKILIDKYGFKRLSFATGVYEGLLKLNPIIEIVAEESFDDNLSSDLPLSMAPNTYIRLQELVDMSGWEVAKTRFPDVRRLLQRYGTEAGREIHGDNCWVDIVKREIEANPKQDYVITDVRFPNELEAIHGMGGHSIRILRDGVTSVNNHISDAPLEGVRFELSNDGSLEELEGKVDKALELLKHIDSLNA